MQNRFPRSVRYSASIVVMLLAMTSYAQPAQADDAAIMQKIDKLAKLVEKQQDQLSSLSNKLNDRQKQIDELKAELKTTKRVASANAAPSFAFSPTANPQATASVALPAAGSMATPAVAPRVVPAIPLQGKKMLIAGRGEPTKTETVGEAPADNDKPPEVPLLANVGGVLTTKGHMVFEPFFEYSRSSVNTFTFQGVQVLPAFLVGQINAVRTARDLFSSGATLRAGITDRFEIEGKVPFIGRQDAFTNVIPTLNGATETKTTYGYGLGDIELAGHYQINDGQEDWPFFIANMRLKSATGKSPYDVPYHADGTAGRLATGSGFTAIEPSMTIIYPTDPAVLFANLGYIHSFGGDINKDIAGNFVETVDPGDTYVASFGVGVALNDKVSFTLGYEHDYVRPTVTTITGASAPARSDALQVGSALTGLSFKANDHLSFNLSVATGVTRDAPDAEVMLRIPYSFNAWGK